MKAQRTELQAYKHVLKLAVAGKLSTAGQYIDKNGNPCAVGCLFNKAQLDDIVARGSNSRIIDGLAPQIGQDNIKHVTGLGIRDLRIMQNKLDNEGIMQLQTYLIIKIDGLEANNAVSKKAV
jgi:hypothetical protein